MQINRFYSVIAILGVMIMTLAIAGCGTKTVSVSEVTYKDMPLQIHNDANVTALNKATITPTLTGQVVYAVKVGDQVQQGQTVATVDTSALQQQLASLQGQLAQAQSQSYASAVTTTTAASIDSAQLEQAQRMREAGIITQKNMIVFWNDLNHKLQQLQPVVEEASIRRPLRHKSHKYRLRWRHLQSWLL